jgi:hypothetical protein
VSKAGCEHRRCLLVTEVGQVRVRTSCTLRCLMFDAKKSSKSTYSSLFNHKMHVLGRATVWLPDSVRVTELKLK